jgi:predicted CXXCH cytochrome family protein
MFPGAVLLLLLGPALLVVLQAGSAVGRRGITLGAAIVLLPGAIWCALEWIRWHDDALPDDPTTLAPVTSETCYKCHESHYASWKHTFHRTMTREATPEFVKADFDNAEHTYMGVTSRLIRQGDRYFMDLVDPAWASEMVRRGVPLGEAGTPPRRKVSVDRLVGSHWFQQMLHRDETGRYVRLPLAYHIVEKRWIHLNGTFLLPPAADFFANAATWNETCVYCHNTRPSKNVISMPGSPLPLYRTEVGELGISCEACHGAGERHVNAHQNPARRLSQRYSQEGDPTIINPARLPVARSDDVCGHCHGRATPRFAEWNPRTQADPFLAGDDLTRHFQRFWSEAENRLQLAKKDLPGVVPPRPEPLDGTFWGDGTPLTTALEYQSMALSACYQNGQGEMRCLTCHAMHNGNNNHQVKEGMRTNAACYGCHPSYRDKLTEHTHHAADSAGSNCLNCHMAYQVFSLLDTHRSHRIAIPHVKDSLGTGKPHACNLCHLDKSLGWTNNQLAKWYGAKPAPLSEEERTIASSVLHLAKSDARSRAVVAGAFSWKPAQEASGRDWMAPLLLSTMENERYEAVRYLAYRSLRSLHGSQAVVYDYEGSASLRADQIRRMRLALDKAAPLNPRDYPDLPLTAAGRFSDSAYNRLLRTRNDPDVTANE